MCNVGFLSRVCLGDEMVRIARSARRRTLIDRGTPMVASSIILQRSWPVPRACLTLCPATSPPCLALCFCFQKSRYARSSFKYSDGRCVITGRGHRTGSWILEMLRSCFYHLEYKHSCILVWIGLFTSWKHTYSTALDVIEGCRRILYPDRIQGSQLKGSRWEVGNRVLNL